MLGPRWKAVAAEAAALTAFAALGGILALAAWLRLANAPGNPGWYTDEGAHLDIARRLLAGQVQFLAVRGSLLVAGRLPLFDELLAGVLRLAGGDGGRDMAALRGFTGTLGALTTGPPATSPAWRECWPS